MTWLRSQLRVTPVAMTKAGRFEVARMRLIAWGLPALWGDGVLTQLTYAVIALGFLWTFAKQEHDSL